MPVKKTTTVLFLNENPLPKHFTKGTISGKELRLRSAIDTIDQIHTIAPSGFYVAGPDTKVGELEQKIIIHQFSHWPYFFRSIPLFFLGLYLAIKLKPITIEAESPTISGFSAMLIGQILRIPTLIEVRSNFHLLLQHSLTFVPMFIKQAVFGIVEKIVITNATHLITNSNFLKNLYQKRHDSISVINPGLQYPPKTIKEKSNKTVTIGFLGRLAPEKGVHLLLQAMAQISRKHPQLKYKLVIAGDGPEKNRLNSQVKKLGLSRFTNFPGLSPNYQTLASFDIFINPITVQAPLEMVNAEASYMKIPVICFGTDQLPETVQHNQTGIKVTPTTSAALEVAILKLLQNQKKRTQLSQNSRKFAQQNYGFPQQVKKLSQVYRQLNLL